MSDGERTYSIYQIRNLLTDMAYVGATCESLQKRFGRHFREPNSLVGQAMRAIGKSMFVIELLEACPNQTVAYSREQFHIARLATLSPSGYNRTIGGAGVPGLVGDGVLRRREALDRGETSKNAATSQRLARAWQDPAFRERMTAKAKATARRTASDRAERMRRRWQDPEYRARMAQHFEKGLDVRRAKLIERNRAQKRVSNGGR
ncbi:MULTISPECIES: GIY-YIG nuclease family protein [unclassified Paraburkholderia]|uniref:GIY-YIG nuclease family protein n=1 Tax=unclassified Paraburkholderia TaxID=2615204 RepID=UPI0016178996|nr:MULTISPECIES: GIY-YIG nuclease family protein [unclassified Paraburkholderia]MBB5448226.1 hypothetical protein [Paraburkholderia sp. WSM4177]MBB5488599.1 hypothetical protein [Paraburkholderia sp. WSM4180]